MATLVDVVNAKNETVDRCELPEAIFAAVVKPHVLHDVVRMQLANRRQGTADTKGRSEVSGGGKKPWKQKGTGRARAGTTRSPLWRHGGTVFGPVPRDYSYAFPRMARRRALASALSEKVRLNKLVVVDAIPLAEPKTKALAAFVESGLKLTGKVLFVFDGENGNLELAARNHPKIDAVRALQLHAYHVLNNETVVISRAAAEQLGEVLSR